MRNKSIASVVFRYVVQLPEEEFAWLTIKMLAKRFEVSRCHLSREFSSERGMTLNTFIMRQKFMRAERRLVVDSEVSVRELALSLGYTDYQHFISRFKEHWGESPGRYRKLIGEFTE